MKVLYFAWLKTRVGVGEEDVSPPDGVATVGQLVEWLRARSDGHASAFANPAAVRVAVNMDYVQPGHVLKADDEIAFFPPVTGG